VLSISLGLPKFQIVKQELLSYGYVIHVEKQRHKNVVHIVGFLLPLSMTDGHGKYGI
jgi:transposase